MFECCNILRVRPQGRNTKPHSIVPSRTFFLPGRQIYLLFPPSSAFVGNILMTWNILSPSSKPDLPSARFHLGYSCSPLALVLTPGRVCCQFAQPRGWGGVLCCFLCIHEPLSCVPAWYVCRGWCAVKAQDQESPFCVRPWMCLHFAGLHRPHLWRGRSFLPHQAHEFVVKNSVC